MTKFFLDQVMASTQNPKVCSDLRTDLKTDLYYLVFPTCVSII